MLAFQLNIPEVFSEALASPAYMVATPMCGVARSTVTTICVDQDFRINSISNHYTIIVM